MEHTAVSLLLGDNKTDDPHRLHEALLEQQRRLIEAYDITREGLWEWIIADGIIHHNNRWKEIFGYATTDSAEQLTDFQKRLHPEDTTRVWQAVESARQTGLLFEQYYRIVLPSGDVRHIKDRGRVADWDQAGNAIRMIGSVADVTDEVLLQSHVSFLSSYDELTGLPSRQKIRATFEQMKQVADAQGTSILMIFLDIDDFRLINDSKGHDVGDQLLLRLAQRLQQYLPTKGILSRYGGDEFLLLLPLSDVCLPSISQVANRLLEQINTSFVCDEMKIKITASMGMTIYSKDGYDFNTLLRHADGAMYAAKHAGRNQYRLFSADLEQQVAKKLNLLNQLYGALDQQQLFLVYQPQINVHTMMWDSAEVLMRWRCNRGVLISPQDFIPLAEESGLILVMTDWLIDMSIQTLCRLRSQGVNLKRLAVNIPVSALKQADFVTKLCTLMSIHQLDTGSLELEITESQLLTRDEQVSKSLEALTAAGFHLAIDDFGTGYSNLGQLRKMKVAKLKIDKSFVDRITQQKEDAILVQAIINMAHTLSIPILAEGVETDAQLAYLTNYGCDCVQGYYFAKPLSEADFVAAYQQKHSH
jgi:diguanylate cyclase (GGDEF)-like protein